ncbi:hypothetical protein [Arthrobacter sp. HMWF013]|uniref:hypothetical protein n=1 Tax=Arthrobacter sp. HMWF013 TaxID=2056849 RepID=UPI0015E7FE70|nr:hypothetical protein [Arthrobacter sp. HMWF013]
MSAVPFSGWLRSCFKAARRSFGGVFDLGTSVSAAVDPSVGGVRLQLTVWEQRL